MRKLLSTIALAVLATATVHADPGGKGNGGDKERGGGNEQGGGERGGHDRGGFEQARGQGQHERGGDNEERGQRAAADRGWNHHGDQERADNQGFAGTARDKHGRFDRHDEENQGRLARARGDEDNRVAWRDQDRRGLINGCPPGLAKKNNGCMPPGLVNHDDSDRYDAQWWGLRGLSNVSGYRFVDGNLVRLSPAGAVLNYYPLLGGALAPGNMWPSAWQAAPLSPYYSNYYGLGDYSRYFDGAIYRVNPTTGAIENVAALLTGDTFNVGQRMPSGYDAYNVPYQYRNQYADGPDANYRYSDGYVYRTDPKTQLILAIIQLLK